MMNTEDDQQQHRKNCMPWNDAEEQQQLSKFQPRKKNGYRNHHHHRRAVSFGGFEGTLFDDPSVLLCTQHEIVDEEKPDLDPSSTKKGTTKEAAPNGSGIFPSAAADKSKLLIPAKPQHHRRRPFHRKAKTLDFIPHVPYDIQSVNVVRPRPRTFSDIERDQDQQGWKRNQLSGMALSMGGPGFPLCSLEEAAAAGRGNCSSSDCIEKFEPLLLDYLNMGGNVDDTATFNDFFGHHVGLQGWTLLRVAACVHVNAPKCMLLLLKHGADPLLKDSSGRNVYTEAMATARYGFTGPIEILQSRVPASIRSASKLCDVTEAMMYKLRRGKLGITPQQTRQEFVSMRFNGFTVHSKTYHPNDVDNHFAYMHLLNLKTLQSRSSLPETGDASCLQLLPQVIADPTLATKRRIIFVSHRWLSTNHPDNDENDKFHAIVQLGLAYCDIHGTDPEDCYLWVDYCCIQQTDTKLKTLGIQALPFYILLADAFIAIEHESYMNRAWCLLEYLLGCFMPTKTLGYDLYNFDATSGIMKEMTPSKSDLCIIRPQDGGVTDPADMEYIRALTWFAETHLYKWL